MLPRKAYDDNDDDGNLLPLRKAYDDDDDHKEHDDSDDLLLPRDAHQAEVERSKEVEEQLAELFRCLNIILVMIMIIMIIMVIMIMITMGVNVEIVTAL